MASIRQIEWFNENESRTYPLLETATGKDDAGQLLPNDILADISIGVPASLLPLYVSSVTLTDNLVGITICSYATSQPVGAMAVAAGGFNRATLQPYKAYPLSPLLSDISGWVVFGNFRGNGNYRFTTPTQSQLDARVIRDVKPLPIPYILKAGTTRDAAVAQLVTLLAGTNIEIEAQPGTNTIVLRLIKGAERLFASPCEKPASTAACGLPPIVSINGVFADPDTGELTINFI